MAVCGGSLSRRPAEVLLWERLLTIHYYRHDNHFTSIINPAANPHSPHASMNPRPANPSAVIFSSLNHVHTPTSAHKTPPKLLPMAAVTGEGPGPERAAITLPIARTISHSPGIFGTNFRQFTLGTHRVGRERSQNSRTLNALMS